MNATTEAPIQIGGIGIRYLIDGTETGAGMGVFELTVAPGSRVPPAHSHRDNEELVYVLEGRLRYSVDGETRDLVPGERMYTPKGSVHAFANPHEAPAKALIILTPDIGAGYFRDIAEVVKTPGPPNPAAMAEIMTRYGLTLAKP